MQDKTSNASLGKSLDSSEMNSLSDQQIVQLHELFQEVHDPKEEKTWHWRVD